MISREKVEKHFEEYVRGYDVSDVKVKLKVDHTWRVAALCDRLAVSLDLTPEDRDLAWLSGMLHDIGRFEQLRIYHTFIDRISVNHAMLSADILFRDGEFVLFADRVPPADQTLMEKVIRLHNVFLLPEELSERERTFCHILRDADKIDIMRVNCETPRSEIYNRSEEEFRTSVISEEVFADVMAGQNVNRAHSKTAVDFLIGHIAFVFGLVYPESLRIVREQGYLAQMLSFESENEQTAERLNQIRKKVGAFLERNGGSDTTV